MDFTFASQLALFLSFLHPAMSATTQFVTCNSVVKLVNIGYKNVRLHSPGVKYGSGSGQQSVTGSELKDDGDSYWRVKGTKTKPCVRGTPVACEKEIRLEHVKSKTNLHSHLFQSPLSRNQEVSTFGENGEGDTGDYWKVVCFDGEEFWRRDVTVALQHIDTHAYLGASGHTYGRPIHGQMEIVGYQGMQGSTNMKWKTEEGLYVLPTDFNPFANARQGSSMHDEL